MSFMRSVVGALRARPSLVLGVELADAAARQLVTVPFQRGFPIRYQAAAFVEVHDDSLDARIWTEKETIHFTRS